MSILSLDASKDIQKFLFNYIFNNKNIKLFNLKADYGLLKELVLNHFLINGVWILGNFSYFIITLICTLDSKYVHIYLVIHHSQYSFQLDIL